MRVLYLNPCGRLGGAETSLLEFLASLRESHPAWELWLVLGESGPVEERAKKLGVQVAVEPFPAALARMGDRGGSWPGMLWSLVRAALGTGRYVWRLARRMRALRPDLIHTNGFKMHLLGAWSRPAGTPVVWHIHDYVRQRRVMRVLLWLNRRRCAGVIANSQSVAADVRRSFPGLPGGYIYNAIDLERFAAEGSGVDLDALAGLPAAPPGTVRVGLVGTFARWKGHKVFLQALARLPKEAAVRGYIIGAPIYQTGGSQWSMQELREEASRLGIASQVGFTGFVEDAAAAMRSLDIVVHASTDPEPFGMVIIEAMACGKPVIASQAGGAAELFEDGKNAVGHPAGDVEALARQIARLAGDESLRARLGAAGREQAERLFNRKRLAMEVASVYEQFGRSAPPDLRGHRSKASFAG